MNRNRHLIVIAAGMLAGFAAMAQRISGVLRIPESMLLIAVVIAEVCLIARMYVVSRRHGCRSSAQSAEPGQQ